MNFRDYIDCACFSSMMLNLTEAVANIDAHQPLDGYWDSITKSGGTYRFNVHGDGCEDSSSNAQGPPDPRRMRHPLKPCSCYSPRDDRNPTCYKVSIYGEVEKGIAFSRGEGYGVYEDTHINVGDEVFKGVLKALKEYIEKHEPYAISWSPVSKTSYSPASMSVTRYAGRETDAQSDIDRENDRLKDLYMQKTRRARAGVYDSWCVNNLFPERYVGVEETKWVRRDIYDDKFVPIGYPKIPKRVETLRHYVDDQGNPISDDRLRQLKDSHPSYRPKRKTIVSQWGDERRDIDHLRNSDYMLDLKGNPIEPHDLKIDSNSAAKTAVIDEIRKNGDSKEMRDKLREVKTDLENQYRREQDAQADREREEAAQSLVSSPEHNPNGLRVGDHVLMLSRFASSSDPTMVYKIKSFRADRGSDLLIVVLRKQKDLDSEEFDEDEDNLTFSYATRLEKVDSLSRHIERHKERLNGMIADRNFNPKGLKVGDDVIITGWTRSGSSAPDVIFGKITKIAIKRNPYSNQMTLDATVKTGDVTMNQTLDSGDIEKATPERAAELKKKKRAAEVESSMRRRVNRTPNIEELGVHLTSHPTNVGNLAPGDHVKGNGSWISGIGADWSGILVRLIEPAYEGSDVRAEIKITHQPSGTKLARSRKIVIPLSRMEKDTSPEAQGRAQVSQREIERLRTISAGAGSLRVGDHVTVDGGPHRGKIGRIIGFMQNRSNVNAIVANLDPESTPSQFSTKTSFLRVSSGFAEWFSLRVARRAKR